MSLPRAVALALLVLGAALAPGAGAQTARDNARPPAAASVDAPREVVRYQLSARLDTTAHTVHGDGTLTWTNTAAVPVSELWFHLYLNAFKNERSVFLREPLGPGRGGGVVTDWGSIDVRKLTWRERSVDLWPNAEKTRPGDEDETDVRVPLPHKVAPGETITLEMTWDDKLPSVVERTGYHGSYHFVAQWFPKIARLESDGTWAHFPFHRLSEFYADFGTYDVTLDVPAGFQVGATGPRVEEKIVGDRVVVRHVERAIHDFAWTAWDRFIVRDETMGGVAVRAMFPAGYERLAARELDVMRRTLPHFAERYGPYPYSVLTVVHPPDEARESGGMEYPTLITAGGPFWVPEAIRAIEAVTVHEFGHQYFYGLFASNENAYPFLDEGLNSYAEHEAMDAFFGDGSAFSAFGLELRGAAITAAFADDGAQVHAVGSAAPAFQLSRFYGRLVYVRTAALLETLRRVYGADLMRKVMLDYARRARFRHPKPEDFFAAVEAGYGADTAAMVKRAIMEKGTVDFEVLDVATHRTAPPLGLFDRSGKREVVAATKDRAATFDSTVLLARKGDLVIPVDLELHYEGGASERLVWNDGQPTKRLSLKSNTALRSVIVDPDRRVLLDPTPRNNFALAPEAKPWPTRLALERLVHWGAQLLALVAP